jgi:hypothetical protein
MGGMLVGWKRLLGMSCGMWFLRWSAVVAARVGLGYVELPNAADELRRGAGVETKAGKEWVRRTEECLGSLDETLHLRGKNKVRVFTF